jgi:hypothetical protein
MNGVAPFFYLLEFEDSPGKDADYLWSLLDVPEVKANSDRVLRVLQALLRDTQSREGAVEHLLQIPLKKSECGDRDFTLRLLLSDNETYPISRSLQRTIAERIERGEIPLGTKKAEKELLAIARTIRSAE